MAGRDLTGTQLGRCTVLRRLGKGAMGEVYLAHHNHLDIQVAIKLLPPTLTDDETLRARFQREARLAAKFRHSNAVSALYMEAQDDLNYLVMEYVDGQPLEDHIAAKGHLTRKEALRMAREAAAGLAAAHAAGLIHRDVKPANLMLTSKGEVKVADFGLARHDGEAKLSRSGQLIGTPAFMAPEQARSGPVDARTDIFSLGATLFAMLTGKPPFEGPNLMALLMAICDDPLPRIGKVNPEIGDDVQAVVERMTAKDPDDRFATMGEVAEALDGLLARTDSPPQPARPRPSSSRERARPLRSRGHQWTVPAVVAAIAVLAIAFSFGGGSAPIPPPSDTEPTTQPPPPTADRAPFEALEAAVAREAALEGQLPLVERFLAEPSHGAFAADALALRKGLIADAFDRRADTMRTEVRDAIKSGDPASGLAAVARFASSALPDAIARTAPYADAIEALQREQRELLAEPAREHFEAACERLLEAADAADADLGAIRAALAALEDWRYESLSRTRQQALARLDKVAAARAAARAETEAPEKPPEDPDRTAGAASGEDKGDRPPDPPAASEEVRRATSQALASAHDALARGDVIEASKQLDRLEGDEALAEGLAGLSTDLRLVELRAARRAARAWRLHLAGLKPGSVLASIELRTGERIESAKVLGLDEPYLMLKIADGRLELPLVEISAAQRAAWAAASLPPEAGALSTAVYLARRGDARAEEAIAKIRADHADLAARLQAVIAALPKHTVADPEAPTELRWALPEGWHHVTRARVRSGRKTFLVHMVTDNLGHSFAWVPARWFTFGRVEDLAQLRKEFPDLGEQHTFDREPGERRAWLTGYFIRTTEVTELEFFRFLAANPDWAPGGKQAVRWAHDDYLKHWNRSWPGWEALAREPARLTAHELRKRVRTGGDALPFPAQRWDHPMPFVSYFAARAYARWLGQELPSDGEWQRAARGLDRRRWPWGDRYLHPKLANTACVYMGKVLRDRDAFFRDFIDGMMRQRWDGKSAWGSSVTKSYKTDTSPTGCRHMAGNLMEWIDLERTVAQPLVPPGLRPRTERGGSGSVDPIAPRKDDPPERGEDQKPPPGKRIFDGVTYVGGGWDTAIWNARVSGRVVPGPDRKHRSKDRTTNLLGNYAGCAVGFRTVYVPARRLP